MGVRCGKGPRVAVLVALLLACALPATAGARRDDLPIEGYAPADGAVVQDATRGLAIDFTCPAYHQWTEDVAVTGPVDGYHVVLADAPDVDQHGMLLRDHRVDAREAVALEVPPLPSGDPAPAHCTAAEDDAGLGLLPREPGTYWWQAYRDCQTWVCAGGVEVSDPAQVTVVRTVCTVQRALLQQTRGTLRSARRLLRRHRTRARRARVSRLVDRVAMLRQRLRVVYDCAGS